MKIALVDPSSRSLPYDYFFIRELAKSNTIDFYCSNSVYNEEFINEIKKLNNVCVSQENVSNNKRLVGAFYYLIALSTIMFNTKKYDRIHFMWSILPLLELPFFVMFRKKLVFTFHNDVPHNYRNQTFWFYKIIYQISRKLIFVSNKVKEDFMKNYKIKTPNKALLIRHGIMSADLDEEYQKEREDKLQRKIIFWGNVKKYKGIDTFLRIANSKLFDDFELEIYGKWDKELFNIKEKLKTKNVKLFDYYLPISELKQVLNSNAIFILPYDKATQSGVLYTYLYYKNIFISTNTGDNGDFLIGANLKNLLFDNKNVNDIRKAVDYCFENKETIQQILADQRKKYQWENILEGQEAIYDFKN